MDWVPETVWRPASFTSGRGWQHHQVSTHTRTHAHTHTLGFHVLLGLHIGIMVLMYKLYSVSPYSSPHRNLKTAFSDFLKLNSVWFISCFPHGDQKCPHNIKNTDITILVRTFDPHNIGNTRSTHKHFFFLDTIIFVINILHFSYFPFSL